LRGYAQSDEYRDVPGGLVLVERIHVDLCRLQAGALCR
jgi:hypothetical protein